MDAAVAAAAFLFGLGCLAVAYALIRWDRRSHMRAQTSWQAERAELLDRIMYLSGRTWQVPDEEPPPAENDTDEPVAEGAVELAWTDGY